MSRAAFFAVCMLVLLLSAQGFSGGCLAAAPSPQVDRPPALFILPATPTAEPPGPSEPPVSDIYTDTVYVLGEERTIGDYHVELWQGQDPLGFSSAWNGIVRIIGQGDRIQIEEVSELDPLTGQDITGDGNPDVAIHTFTGGAHCCFSTRIYDLGPTLTELLQSPPSNCSGELKDLDGDGVYEFLTCEDSIAYKYCCFAGSPLPTVVMKNSPGQGYVPASPEFPDAYRARLAEETRLARTGQPGDACEWDETNKCSILPLVLNLLYSGQRDQAMQTIDRYYEGSDKAAFKKDLMDTVEASPLFVSP